MKEIVKEIEKKYYQCAAIIDAPKAYLHFYTTPQYNGGYYVDYEGDELLYILSERGTIEEIKRTKNPDEILFWLLSSLTFEMAANFELNNRRPNEDSRIQLFAKQEELMSMINVDWAAELKKQNEKYLLVKK